MTTPFQQRIFEILGDDHATAGQIAHALGVERAMVQTALEDMDKKDWVCSGIRLIDGRGCEVWVVFRPPTRR